MTNWTPKLVNVAGTDGTTGGGRYAVSDGVCTFTAMLVAHKETKAASDAGFGLTLPVQAASGVRYAFPAQLRRPQRRQRRLDR
ncbi:hypothetical protein ABZV87_28060 [Streptomyces tendae]|uniref:hypothetical protein n=1 Tax=Streptomyces tendae TaxID=1932 RepID=UPI0033A191D5